MRLLDRLLGRAEARSGIGYAPGLFSAAAVAGTRVNARLAENLATANACVSAVASAISSLPAYVYRANGRGREEVAEHPVARLVRRPNPAQTWPDFVEWTTAQALLHGNALSIIDYDGAGRPVALRPVPWPNVQPILLANGTLAFDVIAYAAPWGGTGQPKRFLAGEVFHLRDRSDDGLLGRSRLSRAPEVIANAATLQEAAGNVWRNGATPTGALLYPRSLTQEQHAAMSENIRRGLAGAQNAGRLLLLDADMKFQPLSVTPEAAEMLASRRFSVEEICRIFQVPPPIIQDLSHGTFTNSREAGRWFAQFSLGPWVRKIEAEFARSIFTDPTMHLEIDLSGLMRGDAESRWQSHKIAVDAGILDADEVREIEGFNPRGPRGEPVVA